MKPTVLGVIFGNRDFFPDRLVSEARQDIQKLFGEMGIEAVMLDDKETNLGGVETWAEAKRCAELFKRNAGRIDGILVTLPNFGDEKGVADTIKLSGLNVPILVQAYPDQLSQFTVERRRDGFCGKVSVCNNLKQYGYPFSLTTLHCVHPTHPSFRKDLERFTAVCRVVKGLRGARLGAIGARPNAFNTVRYSEKILQANGISVCTIDLSEMFGKAWALAEDAEPVKRKLEEVKGYITCAGVPDGSLMKMAKLGTVLDEWVAANDLDATAVQCWTSIQANYGINACTLMSMMSEGLRPSACEVDITGVLSMMALQLASQRPAALVDWNNNYDEDPDKCVLFHCGNWAKSFFSQPKMANAEILGTTLGQENTYGAIAGRVPAGAMSFARLSTDDTTGEIIGYVGDGEFTDDPLETFGSKAVVRVPRLQDLMRLICKNGFEHHCAMTAAPTAGILNEAFDTYLGWDVHHHA